MEKENLLSQIQDLKTKMADPDIAQGTADTYSRISGYHRATSRWVEGKSQEYKERKEYKV